MLKCDFILFTDHIQTAASGQSCSGVFIFNFEHISHLVFVFLLLLLSR